MRRALAIAILGTSAIVPIATAAHATPTTTATYIVVLRAGSTNVATEADRLTTEEGGRVDDVIDHSVHAFTVTATEAEAAAMALDPTVAYVERDRPVISEAQTTPAGVARVGASANPALRINGVDSARADVDVAVLDTGIDFQHPDLHVAGGVNCLPSTGCVLGGDDDNGHGTHVAGIVGALDNQIGTVGVAAGARLWAVRVLDSNGNGTVADVVRGVDWVTAHATTIEVANLSLGVTGLSQALYDAVQAAVSRGVVFVAAAGNSHTSVANISPAGFNNVLAVSAFADFDGRSGGLASPTCADVPNEHDDTLADFSNFGPVDLTAPGVCVNSTVPVEFGSYAQLSGTSMAAPHVAGALALLARANNPNTAADVFALYLAVITAGASDWTDDSGDGVTEPRVDVSNPLLFSLGAPPSCAAIATTGLLGAWNGDGTTAATVGPTLQGNTGYSAGEVGNSFLLDGTTTLAAPGLAAASTAVTVEAWIRPTDHLRAQAVISRWNDVDDHGRSYRLLVQNGRAVQWSVDDAGARLPETLTVETPTLFDGNLHHVAATSDAHTMTIYVDGVAVASKPSPGGELEPALATQVRLGTSDGIGDPLHFSGNLDQPSVWARALTAAEVNAIFDAASAGSC
jgi:subtilisin family serine protease